jgi:hypothetical protein
MPLRLGALFTTCSTGPGRLSASRRRLRVGADRSALQPWIDGACPAASPVAAVGSACTAFNTATRNTLGLFSEIAASPAIVSRRPWPALPVGAAGWVAAAGNRLRRTVICVGVANAWSLLRGAKAASAANHEALTAACGGSVANAAGARSRWLVCAAGSCASGGSGGEGGFGRPELLFDEAWCLLRVKYKLVCPSLFLVRTIGLVIASPAPWQGPYCPQVSNRPRQPRDLRRRRCPPCPQYPQCLHQRRQSPAAPSSPACGRWPAQKPRAPAPAGRRG